MRNDKTRLPGRVCDCSDNCLTCGCKPTEKQAQSQQPRITTAESHFLKGYRDRWEDYYNATGSRLALEVVEGLTLALVEGGRLP